MISTGKNVTQDDLINRAWILQSRGTLHAKYGVKLPQRKQLVCSFQTEGKAKVK